jgi:hypothetical protein
MQASPLLLGLFSSPVTLLMTPFSTVTLRPQPTPQKPQIVLVRLVSTAISAVVANSLTPFVRYYRGSHDTIASLFETKSFRYYNLAFYVACDFCLWWIRHCYMGSS